jgi:hypothetical protein
MSDAPGTREAKMGPLYIVTERFDPSRGAEWDRYLAWSGLSQLVVVVSLDALLCPPAVAEVLPEDWPHIVNADFMLRYFVDLDHLLRRAGEVRGRNLLCLFRNPDAPPVVPVGPHGFVFEGYDLVDVQGDVSALTNCGGFGLAFSNAELSSHGLLPSLARAREVQEALTRHYPDESHARCDRWAVFRATA